MEERIKNKLVLGTAGLAGLWGPVDQQESIHVLHQAWEYGITHVDTAPAYADAELLLSKALSQWSGSSPFISTKVGKKSSPDPDALCMDYRPIAIQASVEQSLRLFKREALDRVFLHDPLLMKPEEIAPAIDALLELQRSGKIKSIGIGGNFDARFVEHAASGAFDCFMGYNKFNAIVQTAVSEEYKVVKAVDMEIWQASPLYMGLLGRRYEWLMQSSPEWIPSDHLYRAEYMSGWCAERKIPMTALSLHYLVESDWPDRIVLGASGKTDWEETIAWLENQELTLWVKEWEAVLRESLIFGKKV